MCGVKMWWNDIKDLKDLYKRLDERLLGIECQINLMNEKVELQENIIESIKHRLEEVTDSIDDAFAPDGSIDRMHDKVNSLLKDEKRIEHVILAQKTLDKFEDYMKNVDKLNAMINEFKGCVSMARSAIAERKEKS